ncbi:hypothetical protein TEA_013632 [Camellia sinensis var. sinensis]|uniref:TFIIS N-terminal domain-containing protein n=1 Tax=Camellia sinensis var. sinensis TaxID=542762 RepID=A0A4V3WLL0_CAMSN|nr:hypothetical protein TEA_013632 [Camellia sinensis var. sinensis]
MEQLYTTTSSDLSARTATLISRDLTAFPKTRLCLWISSRKRGVMMMNNNNNNNNQGKEVRLQLRGQFIETTMAMAMKNEIRTESEDSPFELLQSLADMDITFKALKETNIGRHVNRLRKNPSNDVRRLVKQLVSSGSDKNNSEPEPKVKVVSRRDAPPAKPTHSIPLAASVPAT